MIKNFPPLHITQKILISRPKTRRLYYLLSLFLGVLFSIFLVFPCSSICSADEPGIPDKQIAGKDYPFNALIAANVMRRIPVSRTADKWDAYTTGGFSLTLPTYTRKLQIRFGLNGGVIESKSQYNAEILLFHESAAFLYCIALIRERFEFNPLAGLSHTTIYPRDNFEINEDVFSSSESEFGLMLGVEPTILLSKIRIFIPVFAEYIFSSPDPFLSVSISLNAGVAF